jgi:SAM-dependent methyltransferase
MNIRHYLDERRERRRLKAEFDKRKPWITQFTINGKTYGGKVNLNNDNRIALFFDCFPDAKLILDLGSLEGSQTFQLAKHPGTRVVGIEGRDYNIGKANFIKELLHAENVEFIQANLETKSLSEFGISDAVFCSGVLYHLPKPWKLIEDIGKITSRVFIWTHYASADLVTEEIEGYEGKWTEEHGYNAPLSGLSEKSFWITIPSLEKILQKNGFSNIKIYEDNPNHPHGAAVTLGAWK